MKKRKAKGPGVRKLVLNPEIIADLTTVRAVVGGSVLELPEVSASGCGNSGSNIC